MKKYISRQKYLQKVMPFIDKQIIKVITGQRRVGKSFFLQEIADFIRKNNKNANIIYIDKELYDFINIQNADELVSYVKSKIINNKTNAIFIDEVQEISDFQIAIRSFFSQNYDIYITGSNSTMLSGELTTLLSGRYIEIKIFPLTFVEFLEFHNLDNSTSALDLFLRFGGMPYLKNINLEFNLVKDYLSGIYETIILKDVVKRHSIKHIDLLERLILFLADNIGSILSAKKISDFLKSQRLKISSSVILNYLSFLSEAFFINKAQRFDIQGKRYLEILEKYYFTDIGIRNILLGFRPQHIGKIIENIVFMHLVSNGFNVSVGKLYDYEIDFIAEKDNKKIYIQATYLLNEQNVIDREFGNLLKIKNDASPKIVVSYDTLKFDDFQGVKHVRLIDFLSKTNPIT